VGEVGGSTHRIVEPQDDSEGRIRWEDAYLSVMSTITRFAIVASLLTASAFTMPAAAQPTTKPVGKRYAGKVSACSDSGVTRFRFAFIEGNKTAKIVMVDPGKTQSNVKVEAGTYQVKVAKLADGKYTDVSQHPLTISANGWKLAPTCASAKPKTKKAKKGQPKRPRLRIPKRKK
jgi:hypothetical protein